MMIAKDNDPNGKHFGLLPAVFRTRSVIENEIDQEKKSVASLKYSN